MPTAAFPALHMPTAAFPALHLPTAAFAALHMPTAAFAALHMPTAAFAALHATRPDSDCTTADARGLLQRRPVPLPSPAPAITRASPFCIQPAKEVLRVILQGVGGRDRAQVHLCDFVWGFGQVCVLVPEGGWVCVCEHVRVRARA